jgi:hypothetical protein
MRSAGLAPVENNSRGAERTEERELEQALPVGRDHAVARVVDEVRLAQQPLDARKMALCGET